MLPLPLSLKGDSDLEVFSRLGVHPDSIPILEKKCRFFCLFFSGLRSQEALILKQEMLARGGDVAIPWKALNIKEEKLDVLIMGTESQIRALCSKLALQPFRLSELSKNMEKALDNLLSSPILSNFRGKEFFWGKRTYLMGIINMTPDSFSGDGLKEKVEQALSRAMGMVEQGADIIDVGGESTRPGASEVDPEEEWGRVEPFLKEFLPISSVPVSLDTSKAEVAEKGLKMGVDIINDVWGIRYDQKLLRLVKESGAGIILMHNRQEPSYKNLLWEVLSELEESLNSALALGIPQEKIILDPGFGFGKLSSHNWPILKSLSSFRVLGQPLLVGVSRKSFIGKATEKPPQERVFGTAAACALAIERGADIIRVHDLPEMRDVALICDRAIRGES